MSKTTDGRCRLDQAVVSGGLAPSRSRAQDLIRRGYVVVDGVIVTKTGWLVPDRASITICGSAPDFVSRGAEKLSAALDAFDFDPAGRVAIDVGASTGGFSDVLLRRDVARVYAVDVGRGQLHPSIASDARVVDLEQTDARVLDRCLIPDRVSAIVADVSFISLSKVLGPAMALAVPGAWLVCLIKPQFEVGPGRVGKGGIVTDGQVRDQAVESVRDWFAGQSGWQDRGLIPSPIVGGDGNREYLIGAIRHD